MSELQKALKLSPLLRHFPGSKRMHSVLFMGVYKPVYFFSEKSRVANTGAPKNPFPTSQEPTARLPPSSCLPAFLSPYALYAACRTPRLVDLKVPYQEQQEINHL